MSTFVCSAGHLVKTEDSAINIDSLCRACKRLARDREARRNPFYSGRFYGNNIYVLDAPSRIDRVKGFNTTQCLLATQVPGLQKNVAAAIARRLRALKAARS